VYVTAESHDALTSRIEAHAKSWVFDQTRADCAMPVAGSKMARAHRTSPTGNEPDEATVSIYARVSGVSVISNALGRPRNISAPVHSAREAREQRLP
jgi:hypothetical protein